MQNTDNYGFNLPEYTDFFDVDLLNENMKRLDVLLKKITDNAGGFSFSYISKSDYDALTEKGEKTLYFVENNGKIEMYLGEIKLSGGGNAPVSTSVYTQALQGYVSAIEKEEI